MEQKLAKSIGALIKRVRKTRGLTQPQLAERIGKSYETISNIERGVKSPSVQTLSELGVALEVPVRDFFDEQLLTEPSDQKQLLIDNLNKLALSMSTDDLRMLLKLGHAMKEPE